MRVILVCLAWILLLPGCALLRFSGGMHERDSYRGVAAARVIIDGVPYQASWEIQITRTASFNPYDENGLQDRWIIKPRGAALRTQDGTEFWVATQCSSPEPREILGISAMQANSEPRAIG